MDILNIEELREKVEEEIKFNDYNIVEENQINQAKQHHYLTLLDTEVEKLNDLDKKKDQLYRWLYEFYRWGTSEKIYPKRQFDKHLKSEEIKIYIHGDSKWIKFMKIYEKQEAVVKYLERVVKMFENRSYAITNGVKLLKHEGDI